MAILQTFKEGSNHYFCSWWWERRTSPKIITCINIFIFNTYLSGLFHLFESSLHSVSMWFRSKERPRNNIWFWLREKLNESQKIKEGGGGVEGRKHLQANPGILKTPLTCERGAWLGRLLKHYWHRCMLIKVVSSERSWLAFKFSMVIVSFWQDG